MLNCFSPEQFQLSAAEISQKAKIPMTTTYRMLTSLTQGGLIEQDLVSRKYRIGLGLYFLGTLYLNTQNVIRAADPVVKTMNELTNELVAISVFDRGNEVLIYKEECAHAFRILRNIGTILPAYATAVGKAFLSELSEAEIDSLYSNENLKPLTRKTITTKTELKLELEQIRRTGVAFCREEIFEGSWSVGALIRETSTKAVAALSIGLPILRINQDTVEELTTLVKMGASLISLRLGYRDKNSLVYDIKDMHSWWERKQSRLPFQVNNPQISGGYQNI